VSLRITSRNKPHTTNQRKIPRFRFSAEISDHPLEGHALPNYLLAWRIPGFLVWPAESEISEAPDLVSLREAKHGSLSFRQTQRSLMCSTSSAMTIGPNRSFSGLFGRKRTTRSSSTHKVGSKATQRNQTETKRMSERLQLSDKPKKATKKVHNPEDWGFYNS
jgi:hypothetical protein